MIAGGDSLLRQVRQAVIACPCVVSSSTIHASTVCRQGRYHWCMPGAMFSSVHQQNLEHSPQWLPGTGHILCSRCRNACKTTAIISGLGHLRSTVACCMATHRCCMPAWGPGMQIPAGPDKGAVTQQLQLPRCFSPAWPSPSLKWLQAEAALLTLIPLIIMRHPATCPVLMQMQQMAD